MTLLERVELAKKERRDNFIRDRTVIESELKKFADSYTKMQDKFKTLVKCPYSNLHDTKEIFPSLYEDQFDLEKYRKEYEVLANYLTKWREVKAENSKEVQALLDKYEVAR